MMLSHFMIAAAANAGALLALAAPAPMHLQKRSSEQLILAHSTASGGTAEPRQMVGGRDQLDVRGLVEGLGDAIDAVPTVAGHVLPEEGFGETDGLLHNTVSHLPASLTLDKTLSPAAKDAGPSTAHAISNDHDNGKAIADLHVLESLSHSSSVNDGKPGAPAAHSSHSTSSESSTDSSGRSASETASSATSRRSNPTRAHYTSSSSHEWGDPFDSGRSLSSLTSPRVPRTVERKPGYELPLRSPRHDSPRPSKSSSFFGSSDAKSDSSWDSEHGALERWNNRHGNWVHSDDEQRLSEEREQTLFEDKMEASAADPGKPLPVLPLGVSKSEREILTKSSSLAYDQYQALRMQVQQAHRHYLDLRQHVFRTRDAYRAARLSRTGDYLKEQRVWMQAKQDHRASFLEMKKLFDAQEAAWMSAAYPHAPLRRPLPSSSPRTSRSSSSSTSSSDSSSSRRLGVSRKLRKASVSS